MTQRIAYSQRYDRNYCCLSQEDQKKLIGSSVAVVGCGGLGGFIAEELCRLGIGRLILIDGDRHEETNLNRQLTATEQTLGQWKVQAAKERLQQVNSSVIIDTHTEFLTRDNAGLLFAGADLVMDALDSVSARKTLEQCCHDLGLKMVFAAIDGWYGMLGVSFPGDYHLAAIYGSVEECVESAGNPVFTPGTVASLAVAEAVKILAGKPEILRQVWLLVNLLNMEFKQIYYNEKN